MKGQSRWVPATWEGGIERGEHQRTCERRGIRGAGCQRGLINAGDMNTKHFTNSPFQRERAKLGQTQKPALAFLSGKDLICGLSLILFFSWWFLHLLVCLSSLASCEL